jgi:hypothetical protein
MTRFIEPTDEMRAAAPDLVAALTPVRIAETREEREAIYRFRYTVYVEELGRKLGNADDERGWVHDPEDEQPYTLLLYTTTADGELIGTLRLRRWDPGAVPPKDWEAFSMAQFDGIERLVTAEAGRLMIKPDHRGQSGLVSLVTALCQLCAQDPGVDVLFQNCAAGLVRHYRLLGMRCYDGALIPTPDGIEVPLVAICSDVGYLERVGSFLAPFARLFYGPEARPQIDSARWAQVLDAQTASVQVDSDAVWEQLQTATTAGPHSVLDTLSPDTVRKLSEKGFLMRLREGQLLTEKGLAQKEVFMIVDGTFEAHDGERRIGVMGPGDVIGEIGFFGSSGRRCASVTAVSDGQVLALRRRFVDELRRTDAECAADVLFALGRALADRMHPAAG